MCAFAIRSGGCQPVIFLCKSKVAEYLCHFAVKSPYCSNFITKGGGFSYFLFQFRALLAGVQMQLVNVNFSDVESHRFADFF